MTFEGFSTMCGILTCIILNGKSSVKRSKFFTRVPHIVHASQWGKFNSITQKFSLILTEIGNCITINIPNCTCEISLMIAE